MEGSGKEISMREYPVSRQDNRTAAVADSYLRVFVIRMDGRIFLK